MQKNSKSVNKKLSPTIQNHRLDRMARPYLYWLYVFACLTILIMLFLMFVDTEGIIFEVLSLTKGIFNEKDHGKRITLIRNNYRKGYPLGFGRILSNCSRQDMPRVYIIRRQCSPALS